MKKTLIGVLLVGATLVTYSTVWAVPNTNVTFKNKTNLALDVWVHPGPGDFYFQTGGSGEIGHSGKHVIVKAGGGFSGHLTHSSNRNALRVTVSIVNGSVICKTAYNSNDINTRSTWENPTYPNKQHNFKCNPDGTWTSCAPSGACYAKSLSFVVTGENLLKQRKRIGFSRN